MSVITTPAPGWLSSGGWLAQYPWLSEVFRNGSFGAQAQFVITAPTSVGAQATYTITASTPIAAQARLNVTNQRAIGAQTRYVITALTATGAQSQFSITKAQSIGAQARYVITKPQALGAQVNTVRVVNIGAQARFVLYNTTQLRVLREFPSRGTDGLNWTASSTQAGDFLPRNLNTDIVEQYWRSASGNTTITLTCDTQVPQGVFVDTIGILQHNFTLGARIILEASNDPGFSPVQFTTEIENELVNSYWMNPDLPNVSFRYWRFIVQDTGNPDTFVRIGTIVFGSAIVLSTTECMVDQIKFKLTQYTDSVNTEGFTNVRNDRGRKRQVSLDFRNLQFQGVNIPRLRQLFETAGTILKCLWVPTPEYPSRFAVFGKLTELPNEEHNDKGRGADYVSLSVTIDESQ